MEKRPIVIEFTGLPNSGKTTLLHNLKSLCEEDNLKCIIVQECAELLPAGIPKGTTKTAWITLEMLQSLLVAKQTSNVDFVLVDRGYYDSLFWASLYKDSCPEFYEKICKCLEYFNHLYNLEPTYLFVVDVSVEESIRRRMALGTPITFSKEDFLRSYQEKFAKFCENFNHFYLDTTNLSKDEVATIAFEKILLLLKP